MITKQLMVNGQSSQECGDTRHNTVDIETFQTQGFLVLPSFISAAEIDAALPGLFRIFPTPAQFHEGKADFRSEGFKALGEQDDTDEVTRFRPLQFAGLREFPFDEQELNLLPLHPAIINLAADLLGEQDVRLYQADIFAKYAGVTKYAQPYHVDYTNHMMLPPGVKGAFRQISMFLYLSDMAAADGPPRIVDRRLTDMVPLDQINAIGSELDCDQVRAWEDASVLAEGPKGTLLVYAADVVHRATEISRERGSRFTISIGYKADRADWIGANPWPRKGFYDCWNPLVYRCSVRQLMALGFPPPGHEYWTQQTLEGARRRYPELDLTPWEIGELSEKVL